MGKPPSEFPILLRWSDHVPASDVQDPLGLGLRGSTRLASRMLYCITSITPRARYFSFIPWCVYDYQQREKDKPFALGLWDAIVLREQALTLACIAHHKGEPCSGGGLVGSRDAKKWFAKHEEQANFRKLKKFSKNPALSAYLNSIVNLGFFVTEGERPDSEEETTDEEINFNDIKLSDLGQELARSYDTGVGGLTATKQLSTKNRSCSLTDLSSFGERGGLCELSGKASIDRDLLQNIFFALVETKGESHRVRRKTLLLLLELCRQLSPENWVLNEPVFAGAVYYGSLVSEESGLDVSIPRPLLDITTRWRMFYFHHYMAVALEGLFSWLVSQLGSHGLAGTTIKSLVSCLDESAVRRNLSEILEVELEDSFGRLSPSKLFSAVNIPDADLDEALSKILDETVGSMVPFAEDNLENIIRSNEHLYAPTGLALPMILLAVTLGRYTRWETTNYGRWLATAASDPYLDLVPPLLTMSLSRRFGNWWKCKWEELTEFVLSRYVVQQHQSMSYEKTWTGDRCLLQVDGQNIFSTGVYEKIGLGNPRLGSAIQILNDLGLMRVDEDGVINITREGKQLLKQGLAKDIENEVP